MSEESEQELEAPGQRERRAAAEAMRDQRANQEPLLGPLLRWVLVLVVVGAPMLLMTFAVVHMNVVQREMVAARGQLGIEFTDTELYTLIALNPWLILYSTVFSCGVTSVVVGAVAIIAGSWIGVSKLLGWGQRRAASRRYGRMVGDDVTVAPDAWDKNLPEPDELPDD